MYIYITSALQRNDVKAVGLQMALDLIYKERNIDLTTGLKTRTQAGRPNWDKVREGKGGRGRGREREGEGGRDISIKMHECMYSNIIFLLQLFKDIQASGHGQVTVFFCGSPVLAKVLSSKCDAFGFKFKKENF